MLSASEGFVAAAANGAPPVMQATLTLSDSTTLTLDGDRFMLGGVSLSEATSSASSFDVGAYVQPTASLTLNNHDGALDDYDLAGADLTLWVGLVVGGQVEWVRRGRYRVERPSTLGTVASLSCVGWASALLAETDWPGTLQFPATCGDVVGACCAAAGVVVSTLGWAGADTSCGVEPPDGSSCLDVLRMALRVAGIWCREEPDGSITPGWYDPQQAAFAAWANSSVDVCVSDVVVTGVRVTPAATDEDAEPTTAMSGTEGYVLDLGTLQLVSAADAQDVADSIAAQVVGMSFRPFRCTTVGTPLLQAGDAVEVTDQRGVTHASWATSVTWTSGGYSTLSCDALTPDRNLRATGDGIAQTVARTVTEARSASMAAAAAQAVADATGQHFWHRSTDPDADGAGTGAFVTDEEQETFLQAIASGTVPTTSRPLHNLLMNAEGILLRAAKRMRAAFTPSVVAFYDGQGNAASNIVASFGATSTIGRTTGAHMEQTSSRTNYYDGYGTLKLSIGTTDGNYAEIRANDLLHIASPDAVGTHSYIDVQANSVGVSVESVPDEEVLNYFYVSANSSGKPSYDVMDPAAFRRAINAAGASDQSAQNVLFSPMTGASQLGAWYWNVTNDNNSLKQKRVAAIFTDTYLSMYNSTDSTTLWRAYTTAYPQPADAWDTSKSTTVSSVITAASGITVSSVTYAEWGKMAQLSVVFTGMSASTGSQTVGTVVDGKRPAYAVYATDVNTSYAVYAQLTTAGALTVYWGTAPSTSTSYTARFIYILA